MSKIKPAPPTIRLETGCPSVAEQAEIDAARAAGLEPVIIRWGLAPDPPTAPDDESDT